MIWLSEADVLDLLDPVVLCRAIEAELAAPRIVEGGMSRLGSVTDASGYLSTYPALATNSARATVKVLTGARNNARDGRPEIDAVIVVVDMADACIRAVIAARALTAMRTAAATAIAVQCLCRDHDIETIGLVGTGTQARAHIRTFAALGLGKPYVIAAPRRGHGHARAIAGELAEATGAEVQPSDIAAIASSSDVIVTATLSSVPLIGGDVRSDSVIACVGPFYPGDTEIDPALCRAAALVVSDDPERLPNQWQSAPRVLPDEVVSLRDLVAGTLGNMPSGGLRIFLSDGRAFEDNIAAGLVLEQARALGRGMTLS